MKLRKVLTNANNKFLYFSSPNNRFRLVRFLGVILCTWPIDFKLAYTTLWWFYVANHASMLVPTLRAFVKNLPNVVMATYSWLEMMIIIECLTILVYTRVVNASLGVKEKPRTIIRRTNRRDFQVLITTAESRLEIKRAIAKDYTNLCTAVYLLLSTSYLIVTFMFFQHPTESSQQLLLTATYSFDLKSGLVRLLVYINQIFVLLQAASIPHLDLVVAILIYMCADRLKQLEIDFKSARSYEELVACAREHQRALR